MKRLASIPVVAAIALSSILFQASVHGGIIYDSLSDTERVGAGTDTSEYGMLAQAFNAGTESMLTGVVLDISGWTGTFNIELWSSSEGSPSSIIGAPLGEELSMGTDSITGLSRSLIPGATYFIVVRPVGGHVVWEYTDGHTIPASGFTDIFTSSDDSGFTWSPPDSTNPQRMIIEAVPEPSTWAGIVFLSVLGIGHLGRKLFHFARN